jgi:hypothetical protein
MVQGLTGSIFLYKLTSFNLKKSPRIIDRKTLIQLKINPEVIRGNGGSNSGHNAKTSGCCQQPAGRCKQL